MNNNVNRLSSRKSTGFYGTLFDNPVLSSAAGLPLIAGACTSLANALILSTIAVFLLPFFGALAAFEKRRLSDTVRPVVFFLVSSAVVMLLSLALDNIIKDSVIALGIFAPLLACEALSMCAVIEAKRDINIIDAALSGLSIAVCFTVIALPIGFIRGFFGSGELFGFLLGFRGCDAFALPGMGFILCGVALAVFRALRGAKEPVEKDGDGV